MHVRNSSIYGDDKNASVKHRFWTNCSLRTQAFEIEEQIEQQEYLKTDRSKSTQKRRRNKLMF